MPRLTEQGKPYIYLLEQRELEKSHTAKYTKSPEAIAECSLLVDTLFRVVESRVLEAEDLSAFRSLMKSRHKYVWERAGSRLMQLSHYFSGAVALLFELLGDRKSTIRLRIIQSIWTDRPPIEITKRLIEIGLADSSTTVRQFAQIRADTYLEDRLTVAPSPPP